MVLSTPHCRPSALIQAASHQFKWADYELQTLSEHRYSVVQLHCTVQLVHPLSLLDLQPQPQEAVTGREGRCVSERLPVQPQRQKTHSHIHTDNYDPCLTWHTHMWSTRDRKNMETPSERPELTRNLLLANKHPNTETSLGLFSKHSAALCLNQEACKKGA